VKRSQSPFHYRNPFILITPPPSGHDFLLQLPSFPFLFQITIKTQIIHFVEENKAIANTGDPL